MGTWVLWGVLRSQWANPLYIPLTWPDITIHFCHSLQWRPTSLLLSFNFWELQEITHSPLSRELNTEIKLTVITPRFVSSVLEVRGAELSDLSDFTREIFSVLSSLRSLYLGRDDICLNTQKIQGRRGANREKCEASWYHHLIFTLSGGDSTGSIIPIETGIFNMKIPQVLFKIIQP